MVQFSFLRFLVLCYSLLPLLAEDEMKFPWKCPTTFQCGKFGELQFPFTNTSNLGCGLPIMHCDDGNQFKIVHSPKTMYRLESIDGINSVSVTDHRLKKMLKCRNCTAFTYDLKAALPPNSSMLSFQIEMKNNITLLRCKQALANSTKYIYHISCNDSEIYYPSQNFETGNDNMVENECSTLQLPISSSPPVANSTDLYTFLHAEFRMLISVSDNCLKCQENGTQCDIHNFHCTSTEGADPRQSKLAVDIILKTGLVAFGFVSVITLSLITLLIHKRRNRPLGDRSQARKVHCSPCSNPIQDSGSNLFGVPVFSYTDLVKATTNFDEASELGSGAFGTVYYGKLNDGREVAVKRLYEHHYRRMEQFMNEIEILTRLRHKNLVSLYGCSSPQHRELLLVYEYVPNGTVACHLHGNSAKASFLPWHIRMRIAIETASALTYLHASSIIHRDVKTNNILLDNNFCVKVADFGLSRLFPSNVTHVSTALQGTPGYVDPSYHQCYQLTSKSDVYSFGVVLVELISSIKAVDITRGRDEINLSHLAIKKIKNGAFSELVDPSLGFELDEEIKRKTISVAELAFQCLQEDKDLRPSMVEVLDSLKKIDGGKDELSIAEVRGATSSL